MLHLTTALPVAYNVRIVSITRRSAFFTKRFFFLRGEGGTFTSTRKALLRGKRFYEESYPSIIKRNKMVQQTKRRCPWTYVRDPRTIQHHETETRLYVLDVILGQRLLVLPRRAVPHRPGRSSNHRGIFPVFAAVFIRASVQEHGPRNDPAMRARGKGWTRRTGGQTLSAV